MIDNRPITINPENGTYKFINNAKDNSPIMYAIYRYLILILFQ